MKFKDIVIAVLFIVFLLPSVINADVLDEELPADTPLQVKERARQIIDLGIENHGIVKMTQAMLENRFSQEQILSAYNILAKARDNNLPEEPIMSKLYEGVAKHVRSENIVMAMDKVRLRYKTAGELVQTITGDGIRVNTLTRDMAECLAAGMSEGDLSEIGEMLRKRDQSDAGLAEQTIKTTKTIARMGVESSSAAGIVKDALSKGYDSIKMNTLERAFVIQTRSRSNPNEVAKFFSQGIRAGVSVDDMATPGYSNAGRENSQGYGNYGGINSSDSKVNSGGYGGSGNSGGSSYGSGGAGGSGRSGGGGRKR